MVQSRFVDVEGVAVLHEELAYAQQAGFRAGLVAELGLDLIPDLRQLLVGTQLVARDGGHDLFVSHAEGELGAFAIGEAKHVLAHAGPASGLFPKLARVQRGEQELLRDGVHFFADDGDDLVDRTLAEEEIRVDAGAELAHIAGAQKQLVACDFGVGGRFTECGNEKFRPAVHACLGFRSSPRTGVGKGACIILSGGAVGVWSVGGNWIVPLLAARQTMENKQRTFEAIAEVSTLSLTRTLRAAGSALR